MPLEPATLHMDTYKVVSLLKEKGYSEEAAKGFIEAMQEITLYGVATRQDVAELRTELKQDIAKVQQEITEVRTELHELRAEAKQEMSNLKADLYKFMFLNSVAVVGLVVALNKLLG